MSAFPEELLSHLEKRGVVAGFSVEKIKHAVPLAKALLRTPIGLNAVKLIANEVPEMVVGVGTILTPETAVAVKKAGAHFGVAPGMNPRVVKAAREAGLPFAPGICTPSDLEAAIELGCRFVKFFPAEAAGGVTYLKSMAAPYNHLGIRYFPLGGVNSENMLDYLAEDNVPTVGGTWFVAKNLVQNEDWAGITAAAQKVVNTLKTS